MAGTSAVSIRVVSGDEAAAFRDELAALLRDAVEGGASVGFLPPLGDRAAAAYWDGVVAAVRAGERVLLVARDAEGVVGTAQLDFASSVNGSHRAEVSKVLVHRRVRRRGIGRALMAAVEAEARRLGRTTLHLDTRRGDPSEQLYRSLGWTVGGAIPRWARSADGALDTTVFYYKLLDA